MEVGEYVMISDDAYHSYPKGFKFKLLAKIKYEGSKDVGGAIVEYHKGSCWSYVNQSSFDIVDIVEDYIHQETLVTFIPLFVLTEYVFNEKIILHNLNTKWSVIRSDSYNKFRKEFLRDNGYDIHKNIYG